MGIARDPCDLGPREQLGWLVKPMDESDGELRFGGVPRSGWGRWGTTRCSAEIAENPYFHF